MQCALIFKTIPLCVILFFRLFCANAANGQEQHNVRYNEAVLESAHIDIVFPPFKQSVNFQEALKDYYNLLFVITNNSDDSLFVEDSSLRVHFGFIIRYGPQNRLRRSYTISGHARGFDPAKLIRIPPQSTEIIPVYLLAIYPISGQFSEPNLDIIASGDYTLAVQFPVFKKNLNGETDEYVRLHGYISGSAAFSVPEAPEDEIVRAAEIIADGAAPLDERISLLSFYSSVALDSGYFIDISREIILSDQEPLLMKIEAAKALVRGRDGKDPLDLDKHMPESDEGDPWTLGDLKSVKAFYNRMIDQTKN